MKTIKYIALFSAAMLVLAGCAKKEQPFQPGEPDVENCYGVYFPAQEASGSHTFDPESERVITVTIARSQDAALVNDAITVPYTLTSSEDGVFQAGDITFASGQSETELEITFPDAEQGVNYSFNLAVTNPQYVSTYTAKATSLSGSVLVVSWEYIKNPNGEKALFEFTQDWWGEVAWAYVKYYEVNGVRTCYTETQPKHYDAYNDKYYTGYGFFGQANTPEEAVEWTFTWYVNEKNSLGYPLIELPFQYSGYTTSAGVVRNVSDGLWYYVMAGEINASDWLKFAHQLGDPTGTYPCSYYDGNGGLYIFTTGYYGTDLRGSWTDYYDVIGIGEGFVRVDYSLSMETDYCTDGAVPVYVEAGMDVAQIKYALYPGELKDGEIKEKVEAISKGTEETASFSEFQVDEEEGIKYATMNVSAPKTGTYTMVAVGFDKDNGAQEAATATLIYVSKDDEKEHAVKLKVGTEEVPARFGDFSPTSSFAFYIAGENLEEVHFDFYDEEDYLEDPEAVLKSVKLTDYYLADETELAEINREGGFYSYIDELDALTTYYVVVWATNGEMEDYAIATFTTTGLPNVLLGTGTFRYTGWKWDMYETAEYIDDPGLEFYQNPNKENTYVITHWGYDVDLSFQIDPETGLISLPLPPYTFTGQTYYGYYDIYVSDSNDFWNADFFAKNPQYDLGASYYDSEKGVLYFNLTYYSPQANGAVSYPSWETFTLDPVAEPTMKRAKKEVTRENFVEITAIEGSPKVNFNKREFKSLPREAKPVQANVTVSYNRKAKENKRFEEPTLRVLGTPSFE